MNKIFLMLILPLASSLSFAASFELQDQNEDGMISKDEWQSSANGAGIFRNWDANADSYMDENEYNDLDWDYDHSLWDRNGDAHLEDNEIYDGLFDAFDDNEDGHWDRSEWDDAGDEGWFDV